MSSQRRCRWLPYAVAGGGYLMVSVALWWHVGAHPATSTTCGCGDAALTLWVIEWPAHAIAHGQDPFFSSQLFAPHGINMVPNSLALGVVFAPVTWLFGPVASMNAIDVLSPPLSALAMFYLLRRWVLWPPAAFVGGVFFGFSPFVLVSLAFAHPNFGLLALLPLMVACLDDLFVTHAHRPIRAGVVLGLLVAVEFFVSVEVLALLALFSVFVAAVVAARALIRRSPGAMPLVARALPGLCAAGALSALLLAYPLWFFFAGPAHLAGRAWPDAPAGIVGSSLGDFVTGHLPSGLVSVMHLFGGYQGPALPALSFVGVGMLVVLAGGMATWRHDRRLWLFAWIGLAAAVLSLGVGHGSFMPWRLFVHVPVLVNVVPVNMTVIADFCAAVMLGVIIGHVRDTTAGRFGEGRTLGIATATATATAVVALVPVAAVMWPNVPMTIRHVFVPHWFATTAAHKSGKVILPYPAALGGIQSSMAWQAVTGLPFSMVGGGGPGVAASRAGKESPGFEVLADASLPLGPQPEPTAANLRAVRLAMTGWGVTTVVVPDQPALPTYDRGRSVPYAVGLFTAALGEPPSYRSRAWVWEHVAGAGRVVALSSSAFQQCVGRPVETVASCVLAHR
ncbi:MAG: hypothetical protein ACYCV7_13695 [Acidimicrobiales bacterium]